MNIDPLANLISGGLRNLGQSLFLPGKDSFAEQLNLGQVIKGKVLRHYEGGRYLVQFGGQEKVVDSVVPLRNNEVLYGRVVALGDKVELQRVAADGAKPGVGQQLGEALGQTAERVLVGKHEQMVNQLFAKYQGKMTPEAKTELVRMLKTVPAPDRMAMAGLVLSKLGLNQTPELLRALYDTLSQKQGRHGSFPILDRAPQLEIQAGASEGLSQAATQALGHALAGMMQAQSEHKTAHQTMVDDVGASSDTISAEHDMAGFDSSLFNDDSGRFAHLARWLLNAQNEGSVGHRLATLPLWLGGRLVEVDLAVFDQKAGSPLIQGLRHRQLLFSLQMEELGHVEVMAKVAGKHIRIQFMTDDTRATDTIARYMAALRALLQQAGWIIDEVSYGTQDEDEQGQVVNTVVDHIVSQDSLSRLM